MRSPFMLNSGWYEPEIKQYLIPNFVAEAARDFDVTDDRVRLALAHAALREGRKVGRWDVAVEVAAAAAKLDREALLKRAQWPESGWQPELEWALELVQPAQGAGQPQAAAQQLVPPERDQA